jgi:hypothetical protein
MGAAFLYTIGQIDKGTNDKRDQETRETERLGDWETERPRDQRDQREVCYQHYPRLRFGLYGLLGPNGPKK